MAIDVRNISIEYTKNPFQQNGAEECVKHSIHCMLADGTKVAFMGFTSYKNVIENLILKNKNYNDVIPEILFIDEIIVSNRFRNNGVAIEMYKKFGELYQQDFPNWPVAREFINPVAEYTFRKSVSIGYVPETALSEDYIRRDYDIMEDYEKIVDLRNKLPENVKGPEVWT